MNELANETSPYLLQHAQNPVHWKAWNPPALQQAQNQEKLMIVSVGYSACHWCHVMEHESFEDQEVAHVMNAHYVSIKVDREERPDVDAVYMKAVQIMTGRGGWPMNVVCLPDGRAVYGGTYFRKPEWINILEQLQELWKTDPGKMFEYAEKLQAGLETLSVITPKKSDFPTQQNLVPLVEKWKKSFDDDFGGMARAPKFPMPTNYAFLQRYAFQTNDIALQDFVDLTLTKMAFGGIFDTLGGGFSRYSVDLRWHVPHFEKMLYDNGQLVSLYADAFKRTQNPLYREVVEKTLSFVLRQWTTADGAFYSALDADSLDRDGKLAEGAFYVWTEPELRLLLGPDFDAFAELFSINAFGHWEHGHYVLIQKNTLETAAETIGWTVDALRQKKLEWETHLLQARQNRPAPRLDDKILTSWNAIMAKGFVDAYQAFGHREYLETAERNARFLLEKLQHPDGFLWHSHKDGRSTINGFLEDYAHVSALLVALYQTTFEQSWLDEARRLVDYTFAHFYNENSGFFSFSSDLDRALVAPHFELEDNVIPASNSVLAKVLLQLAVYFEAPRYEETVRKMVAHILAEVDYPSAFSNWLDVLMDFAPQQREVAIMGKNAREWTAHLQKGYLPHVVFAGAESVSALPFLKDRWTENENLAYICQNKSCDLPTSDFEKVNKVLKSLA